MIIDQIEFAARALASRDCTTIIDGTGEHRQIESRVGSSGREVDKTTRDHEREKRWERFVKLVDGIAVVRVGARRVSR